MRKPTTGDAEALPSWTLRTLCELGEDARNAYGLLNTSTGRQAELFGRIAKKRADTYDDALDRSLGYIDLIREGRGERAAMAVELRCVDGLTLAEVAERMGYAHGNSVYMVVANALEWLDRTART